MYPKRRSLLKVAVIVFSVFVIISVVVKNELLSAERVLIKSSRSNLLEFFSEGLQSDWVSFCSRSLYVFCDDTGNRNYIENIRQKIDSERIKGLFRARINSTAYLSSPQAAAAARELAVDPYYRVNRRLQSGQPVVIHVVNPQSWLVGDFKKIRCPVSACVFDMDGVTEETDVVMAHGVRLTDGMLPARRWPGQLYVMYGRESPVHYYSDLLNDNSVWRYAFNLTSTYRIDSDIFWPYSRLQYSPWPANQKPDFDEIAKNKTKFAVWLVSNCDTVSLRKEYVEEMKKYIPVDIFGRCGNSSDCQGNTRGPCMDEILSPYKFYLSFENSMCPGYVTEKFFKTFHQNLNIVPVVRGGADYDRFFPKGAFINAGWFRTAKELALYLKNMPHQIYLKYLETNRLFREGIICPITCCICDGIILQKSPPKVYDIKSWIEQPCPVSSFL